MKTMSSEANGNIQTEHLSGEPPLSICIRGERASDARAIADVHVHAFDEGLDMGVVSLVSALRLSSTYNPALSLVAEVEGKDGTMPDSGGYIIGHAMLTAVSILLGGQQVEAAILSPVGVLPMWQRRGIGSRLIREGHRRLRELHVDMVVVLGHSEYYPRFGYRTHMYGTCGVAIDRRNVKIAASAGCCQIRRVRLEDIPLLFSWWEQWFGDVDLSIRPGSSPLDWLSPDKRTMAGILCERDEPIGYVRVDSINPEHIRCIVPGGAHALERMLSWLFGRCDGHVQELTLPLHPDAQMVRRSQQPWRPVMQSWAAGMIYPLNPDQAVVAAYCDGVSQGTRNPGLVIWPGSFDVT